MNYENEYEYLDALCEVIANSQPQIKVLNIPRLQVILEIKKQFSQALGLPVEEIVLTQHPLFSAVSLSSEIDELVVEKPAAFAAVLAQASNVEIYPLTNGRIRISLMFPKAMVPLGE